MKIAGEHPSETVKKASDLYGDALDYATEKANGNLERADGLGALLAAEFLSVCQKDELTLSQNDSESLMTQKILLLSFTVMAGLERFCPNMALANTARTAFFNRLFELDRGLFEKSSDTGAFSFYYLSF